MYFKCILVIFLQIIQISFAIKKNIIPPVLGCNQHIVHIPTDCVNSTEHITTFQQNTPLLDHKFLNEPKNVNAFINSTFTLHNVHTRRKRKVSIERHIELLVVLDKSMFEYHKGGLEKYVMSQIAMVSHIFKHYTVGHSINIKLVGVTTISNEADIIYDTPHLLLRSFCRWQNLQNHPSDKSLDHHDTAMFLTRRKLCGSLKPCSMVGLANVAQICNPENSCFIVEDTGLSASFTIAHELGHVLGIPHDDQEHCKNYFEEKKKRKPKYAKPKLANIMASVQTNINRVWAWSSCSRHFITKHLNEAGKCLLEDQEHPDQADPSHRFAGRFYTVDQQCELRFEKGSKACAKIDQCARLWCSHARGCLSDNSPWADGTKCGSGKWCYQGACVDIADSVKVVDGQWGPWSSWSKCSEDCGRVWQESKRKCNKPKPKNGGRYCLGLRVRRRSCNEHSCEGKASKSKKIVNFTEKKSNRKSKSKKEDKQRRLKAAVEEWFKF